MLKASKAIAFFILASAPMLFAFAQERNLAVTLQQLPASNERVALVIGNSAYQSSPLKNPVNDSRAISAKLRKLGFEVIERENITQRQVGSVLHEFRTKLKPGAVALFFYAGHGLQVRGVNYLPTVDAEIANEEDVPMQSINLNQILDLLDDSKTRMNLIFLDACRNNPYVRNFRSVTNGLSKVTAPSGTLISFATRPGSVAADGPGNNGLYTEKLLENMDKPLPIEQVLKNVMAGVKAASNGIQEPWMEGSIDGDFYFVQPTKAAQSITGKENNAQEAVITQAVEEVLKKAAQLQGAQQQTAQSIAFSVESSYWDIAKNSSDKNASELYLEKYPHGYFAELARNRIALLQREQTRGMQTTEPATQSFAKTGINYKVGDWYQYQSVDLFTGVTKKLPRETVTELTSTDVTYDAGPMKTDLLGNSKFDPTGTLRYDDFPQIFIPEYKVGKKWTSWGRAKFIPSGTININYETQLTVAGREIITVPAGTFDAFKIVGYVYGGSNGAGYFIPPTQAQVTFWVAPDRVNRFIAYEYRTTTYTRYPESERIELVSFNEHNRLPSAQAGNLYGYALGDRYATQRIDMSNQEVIGKNEMIIGSFDNSTIVSKDKNVILRSDGTPKLIHYANGNFMEWSDNYVDKPSPDNLKVGYKQNVAWTYRFKNADGEGEESHKGTMEVTGIETVKVPAGQFEAYKIVLHTRFTGRHSWLAGESTGSLKITNWYVPSIRTMVVSQIDRENAGDNNSSMIMSGQTGDQTSSYRVELTSYKVANMQAAQ